MGGAAVMMARDFVTHLIILDFPHIHVLELAKLHLVSFTG